MGQAFLHGNGGSNPLNFKVVASADYPESTSRNMIPDAYAKTTTYSGITYTVNGDGSITANGTATSVSTLNVWGANNSITLPAGAYTLSGCPSGGSSGTYSLCSNDVKFVDTGSGVTFTLTADTAISFKIRIASGTTVSGMTFKPQLEKGSTATSFVKYAQKVNTIWVKTSIEMNYWTTNAKADTLPTWEVGKGNVVLWWNSASAKQVNSDTSAAFQVLKYNATTNGYMRLVPTSCYQNQDSTASGWKQMNAYIYKSGGWVQFSSEFAATIKVTYPSGSTLTCTDGTTTLTATTTTGSYTFTVPNTGTWTVKAVSGSNTASKSVSITTDGQSASVTLSYTTYYYNKGDQCTSVTGGWSAGTASSGYTAGSPTIGSDSITCVSSGAYVVTSAATVNKVDLSNISKLTIVSPSGSSADNGYYGYFYVSTSRDAVAAAAASVMIPKGGSTVTLDVSGLSGSYYLMLRMLAGANGSDQVDMSVCYGV